MNVYLTYYNCFFLPSNDEYLELYRVMCALCRKKALIPKYFILCNRYLLFEDISHISKLWSLFCDCSFLICRFKARLVVLLSRIYKSKFVLVLRERKLFCVCFLAAVDFIVVLPDPCYSQPSYRTHSTFHIWVDLGAT